MYIFKQKDKISSLLNKIAFSYPHKNQCVTPTCRSVVLCEITSTKESFLLENGFLGQLGDMMQNIWGNVKLFFAMPRPR